MQIILNIILRDHGTAVPGSSPVLIPMDIGRSVACETNGSAYSNPDIIWGDANGTFDITNCHDNLFNFFTEQNIIELNNSIFELINKTNNELYPFQVPNRTVDKINQTFVMLEELSIASLARPQDLLFNLPMFYIGK